MCKQMSMEKEYKPMFFSGGSTISNLRTNKIIETSGSFKIDGYLESYGFQSSG